MRQVPKHKKLHKNPSTLETLTLLAGFIQPLMTVPQIIQLIALEDASQLSLITWVTYDIASFILLLYGIKHKLVPIIVAQVLWLIVQTAIIFLILLY